MNWWAKGISVTSGNLILPDLSIKIKLRHPQILAVLMARRGGMTFTGTDSLFEVIINKISGAYNHYSFMTRYLQQVVISRND
jgi:hypothetical protein